MPHTNASGTTYVCVDTEQPFTDGKLGYVLGSVSSFNAGTHDLPLYTYGVTVNAAPIVTRATANRLGLRASIAEPAIARIRPMNAASGAYWWYMLAPNYSGLAVRY